MLCGISPAFAGLFPIGGQIAHVLRTRAPCTHLYCYKLCTRLACVKHAASVRSEPGSNSRLKPVAWRNKKPGPEDRVSLPSKIVSRSNSLNPFVLENPNGVEQILAHRIGCQRAVVLPPCPAEWLPANPLTLPDFPFLSTPHYSSIPTFPHLSSTLP